MILPRLRLTARILNEAVFTKKQLSKTSQRSLVQIANRQFFPGSNGAGFPEYLQEPRDDFPKLLKWRDNFENEVLKTKEDLEYLGKKIRPLVDDNLVSSAAVLLKDLPVWNYDDLDSFLGGLDYEYFAYTGGSAVRNRLSKKVSTASREPSVANIEPHNEMSYLPRWPKLFLLFCEEAPPVGSGGETVITDVRDILRELDPHVVEKFDRLGIAYLRTLPDKNSNKAWYTSWQESLLTDSREEAEKKLAILASSWKWEQDGTLRSTVIIPALHPHYRTRERLWFNQLHSHNASYFKCTPGWAELDIPDEDYPFHTTYGDGSPIEPEVLQHVRNVAWSVSVGWQMERGDLLILDNMYVQHARLSYNDKRKLLACLVAMNEHYFQK